MAGILKVLGNTRIPVRCSSGIAQGRVGPAIDIPDSAAFARTAIEAAVEVGVPGTRGGNLRISEPGLQKGTATVHAVVGPAGYDQAAVILELRPLLEGIRVASGRAVRVPRHRIGQELLIDGASRKQPVGAALEIVTNPVQGCGASCGRPLDCD